MHLAISTLITMGSSCTGSIALKSSVVKVMGRMLGTRCQETILIDQTCCRCIFRAKEVAHPLVKPSAMVFMTCLGLSRGLSSLSLKRLRLLCLSDQSVFSQSFPQLDFGLVLSSGRPRLILWRICGLSKIDECEQWLTSIKYTLTLTSLGVHPPIYSISPLEISHDKNLQHQVESLPSTLNLHAYS